MPGSRRHHLNRSIHGRDGRRSGERLCRRLPYIGSCSPVEQQPSPEEDRITPVAEKTRPAPDLGTGLYSLTDLSVFVAYRADQRKLAERVPYWLSRALTPGPHRTRRPDYGFRELISLFVVRDLILAGVKAPEIRRAEAYLKKDLGHPRPFATERIRTDGKDILYGAAPGVVEQLTAANLQGQEVLEPVLRSALKDVGYAKGEAAQWAAATGVSLDPDIQFGAPCVAGTRIPTSQVQALATADHSPLKIAEMFAVKKSAIQAALRFEDQLART